jgi:LCP family protein required for cell wall assembly
MRQFRILFLTDEKNFMTQPKPNNRRNRRSTKLDTVTLILLAAFVILAIITSVLTFNLAKNIIAGWTMTDMAGLPVAPQGSNGEVTGENPGIDLDVPLQAPDGPPAQPWDGKSRVTMLVMGLDYRDWEAGDLPRTDTMMLISMDPITKQASMMSIPRDMWVNIPGFEHNKINTAYYFGELYNLPGGGPGLAVETVEEFLGVPINYYAQIDFSAFVRFIDEIEGVTITPKEDITIVPIGDTQKQHLEAGVTYTLPGDLALAYARARYTEGGDFDRAQRQQEVVLSVRDRILKFSMMPTLVAKAPILYKELASGVKTNLDLNKVVQLALFALDIKRENIHSYVIGAEYVEFGKSPDGLDILQPIPDKIRLLRDQALTSGGAVGVAAYAQELAADPYTLVKAENARISIQNGSWATGLAGKTANYLRVKQFNIVEETNGEATDVTTIYLYNGKPYTVKAIYDLFAEAGLNEPRLYNRTDLTGELDITIVLGNDWALYDQQNPLPEG